MGITVKIIGDLKPPKYVIDLLSLGPKHPVLDQFNKMHFLLDIDKVLAQMKNDDSNIDAMNEVNALTVGYLKQMKRQKPDRAVKLVTSYLKKNNLKAVPFDKGAGYSLMSAGDYNERLLEVLNGEQFKPLDDSRKKDVLIAIESTFNRNLMSLVRAGKISSAYRVNADLRVLSRRDCMTWRKYINRIPLSVQFCLSRVAVMRILPTS